ncbi:transcriptional regulator [Aeromonas hydrophila]|uniref:FCD domain-containing protein n=1 Tax=Aeromonas hydrophila TaxID=644 RepID=UPI0005391DEA|nr:FCD domain-containing protein [Aeromonas hydrophila]KHA54540.1 transcriptional regulator [Aeromonas hydrophila]
MNIEIKRPYQEVGLFLRNELLDGQYQIGDRLPPERDIAEQLGVGRTVVREALIMLELENLVEVRKGSGVYVIQLPQPRKHVTQDVPQVVAGPFEMLQARQLLESNIAEFAALQVTPHDILKMRKALEMERQDLLAGESENGDMEFHLAIAEATQNSVLVELFKQSWNVREHNPMWQKLHARITDMAYRQEWLGDHQAILSAMIKKDPEAAKKTMWHHLEKVKQRLMELSDSDDPNFDGYLFSSYPVFSAGRTHI